MSMLLVVGGGLFGSQAAAYARSKGIETRVFDPGLPGAASHAAAGLFKEGWVGPKLMPHLQQALPVLDRLFGLRHVTLMNDVGDKEPYLFVPPSAILDPAPVRETVTAVGDGWLEAGGCRHEGWVYVAAGVWSPSFLEGLEVQGRAGAAFVYAGESEGRVSPIAWGRQAIGFVRDPGQTYFSDGTAEGVYGEDHDRQTLDRAAAFGLRNPVRRLWGCRPYSPGGPVFMKLSARSWLATGGRKMGTILGASFARRLIEEELTSTGSKRRN